MTRVLVIDDDRGIRDMLSLALSDRGYAVTASDGRTIPADAPFDVVLLDARLGRLTARDVAAANPALTASPIVLMTASINPEEASAGVPVRAVLAKPFMLDEVEVAIEAALAAHAAERSSVGA